MRMQIRFMREHCRFLFKLLNTIAAEAGPLLQQLILPDVQTLIEPRISREAIRSLQPAVTATESLELSEGFRRFQRRAQLMSSNCSLSCLGGKFNTKHIVSDFVSLCCV